MNNLENFKTRELTKEELHTIQGGYVAGILTFVLVACYYIGYGAHAAYDYVKNEIKPDPPKEVPCE